MTKKKPKEHAEKGGAVQQHGWGWMNVTTGKRVKKSVNFYFLYNVPAFAWSTSSLAVARSQCSRDERVVRVEIR